MLIVYNFVAKLELATHTFFSYPTPSLPKPTPCSRDCFPDHGIPAPYHAMEVIQFCLGQALIPTQPPTIQF